ncbi:MAG: hypothetical protein KIS85_06690 [Anaerolineales bacterium]|nr:hypothetical protein [Anaerolineales bacterium]
MATSEERLKILQMIQDGKISPADGAKLLEALARGSGRGVPGRPAADDGRFLRVRVTDMFSGRNKVTVNLPLSLVSAGLGIASKYVPGVQEEELMDAIRSGMTGKVVDVQDEEGGDHVEIYIE